MAHIVRENAGKKTKMISELFTYKIFEFTFVSIFADMTIGGTDWAHLITTGTPCSLVLLNSEEFKSKLTILPGE